jgi:hypothetical protein
VLIVQIIAYRNQALAQVCAVCSPGLGVLSVMAICKPLSPAAA